MSNQRVSRLNVFAYNVMGTHLDKSLSKAMYRVHIPDQVEVHFEFVRPPRLPEPKVASQKIAFPSK
ncbi:MAG: hypothetical protein BroJett018_38180 [Chloroflexota bacterium]|nr:MAG: hypothetical protein BroJett018_38180 [Chloroflexota bacterium]